MRIESGVTSRYIYFVAVDSTDFTTRETGLSSFTVYRSRNGAAAAAMTTPTINETDSTNMPGVYELLLDEDMTIGSGNDSEEMVFHITHAGMAPVSRTIELYRPKITAGETLTASSGVAEANAVQISGDSTAADNLESYSDGTTPQPVNVTEVSGDSTAADNLEAAYDGTGYDLGGIDVSALNTAATAVGSDGTGLTEAGGDGDHLTEAGGTGDHLTALAQALSTGTAQTGTTSSMTLEAGESSVSGAYRYSILIITGGTGAGQARLISGYNTTSKVASVTPAFGTAPDNTSTYAIISGPVFAEDLGNNAITITQIAGGAIGASALGSDAVDEIVDAVWDAAQSSHTSAGTFGEIATEIASILVDTAEIGSAGAGLTAVPWNASWDTEVQSEVTDGLNAFDFPAAILDNQIADSVPSDGTLPTIEQALYMIVQFLYERSVSGTTVTVKKVDGSTSLLTLTLDDGSSPTSISRAT